MGERKKVLTRDARGKKERERERERERKRGRTEAMCVICCGPVCVPLGYLLPFLLAWFHQRGYFVWFKEEWVTYRFWRKQIDSFVSRGDKGEVVKTDTCGCNGTEKERSECKKTT